MTAAVKYELNVAPTGTVQTPSTGPVPYARSAASRGPGAGRDPVIGMAMASGIPGDEEARAVLEASKAALALATLTVGATTLGGLPPPASLGAFIAACRGFGAVVRVGAGETTVQGVGIGGLVRPSMAVGRDEDAFGTAVLAGLAAGHDCGALVSMTDASAMVLSPVLAATGATIRAAAPEGDFDVRGARDPLPADHGSLASPAAAVAAAFIALNAAGITSQRADEPLPGCIEVLFSRFGVDLVAPGEAGAGPRLFSVRGRPELRPARIDVAGLVAGRGRPS